MTIITSYFNKLNSFNVFSNFWNFHTSNYSTVKRKLLHVQISYAVLRATVVLLARNSTLC